MRNVFAGLLILFFSTAVLAETTVPYTFTAGSPAKASEVNANFAALVAAINALSNSGMVLPSGATLRGIWGPTAHIAETATGTQYSVISFPLLLPASPTFSTAVTHWMLSSESATDCPGVDSSGLPQAAPGHLCVYQTNSDVLSGVASRSAQWSRLGFELVMTAPGGGGMPLAEGKWAVTAP